MDALEPVWTETLTDVFSVNCGMDALLYFISKGKSLCRSLIEGQKVTPHSREIFLV